MSDLKLPQINRIQIAGRLTRDPELKDTGEGKATCGFSVAVDDGFGEKKKTTFFNCRAWDKQAERVAKLPKGSAVIVEGRMVEDTYRTRDGEEKRQWKVLVGMVHELEWPDRDARKEQAPTRSRPRHVEEPIPDDDIPF